jgi:protein KTI12
VKSERGEFFSEDLSQIFFTCIHYCRSPQERTTYAVMPLVIFSGLPSSGKTTRALQLQKALESRIASSLRKFKVHIINDDTLGINRLVYQGTSTLTEANSDAKSEKAARGAFFSAIQRVLSQDDIVIADGMNYIKGFRYQLFCEAKALSTPHCVVSSRAI